MKDNDGCDQFYLNHLSTAAYDYDRGFSISLQEQTENQVARAIVLQKCGRPAITRGSTSGVMADAQSKIYRINALCCNL